MTNIVLAHGRCSILPSCLSTLTWPRSPATGSTCGQMNDFSGDWSPAIFEERGRELLKMIRCHFESIRELDVARPHGVQELISLLDESLPEAAEDFDQILADTRDKVIPNLVQWNHPSFYGYFP